MSYFYMSNINDFKEINNPNDSYLEVGKYTDSTTTESVSTGVIKFSRDDIDYSASFLMIRARYDNDVLIQVTSHEEGDNYGVYIPANELWSVDSLEGIDKFYIRKIFDLNGKSIDTGYIQWMIGYK